ncbi:MAG: hypothetical protein OSB03_02300 [Vicinamibacterales bacterium]|nr:hypothetical protein [Vicinamibacterales bacterium]
MTGIDWVVGGLSRNDHEIVIVAIEVDAAFLLDLLAKLRTDNESAKCDGHSMPDAQHGVSDVRWWHSRSTLGLRVGKTQCRACVGNHGIVRDNGDAFSNGELKLLAGFQYHKCRRVRRPA